MDSADGPRIRSTGQYGRSFNEEAQAWDACCYDG